MKNRNQIESIHDSLVNGQRRQMVEQIDEYDGGLYSVWDDYKHYLHELYDDSAAWFEYFTDAVQSYHRIKTR